MPGRIAKVEPIKVMTKKVKALTEDVTISPGSFYTFIDLAGSGMVDSIHLYLTGIDYRYIELQLLLDGKGILMGALDNLDELVERVGFGKHELPGVPQVVTWDMNAYRIVWYPNAPFYSKLELKVINNHPTSNLSLKAGAILVYRVE